MPSWVVRRLPARRVGARTPSVALLFNTASCGLTLRHGSPGAFHWWRWAADPSVGCDGSWQRRGVALCRPAGRLPLCADDPERHAHRGRCRQPAGHRGIPGGVTPGRFDRSGGPPGGGILQVHHRIALSTGRSQRRERGAHWRVARPTLCRVPLSIAVGAARHHTGRSSAVCPGRPLAVLGRPAVGRSRVPRGLRHPGGRRRGGRSSARRLRIWCRRSGSGRSPLRRGCRACPSRAWPRSRGWSSICVRFSASSGRSSVRPGGCDGPAGSGGRRRSRRRRACLVTKGASWATLELSPPRFRARCEGEVQGAAKADAVGQGPSRHPLQGSASSPTTCSRSSVGCVPISAEPSASSALGSEPSRPGRLGRRGHRLGPSWRASRQGRRRCARLQRDRRSFGACRSHRRPWLLELQLRRPRVDHRQGSRRWAFIAVLPGSVPGLATDLPPSPRLSLGQLRPGIL